MQDQVGIITVQDGCVTAKLSGSPDSITVSITPRGAKALRAWLKHHLNITWLCSSSCDFPEENGAPGLDFHHWLNN